MLSARRQQLQAVSLFLIHTRYSFEQFALSGIAKVEGAAQMLE